MKSTQVAPALMFAGSVIAAVWCLSAGEYAKALYWTGAAIINFSVAIL